MAIAFLLLLLVLLLVGGAAAVAYAGIAAGAVAGAAALAVFALLTPFLFVLLVFALVRAGVCPGGGRHHRQWAGGPSIRDEWHRAQHERPGAGKAES